MEEKKTIKLTDWEVANFHLPAVTTMTLYEGEATIEFLRSRLALVIKKSMANFPDCKRIRKESCALPGV
jgi:hypothetical protein